jgi:hypothetical protein
MYKMILNFDYTYGSALSSNSVKLSSCFFGKRILDNKYDQKSPFLQSLFPLQALTTVCPLTLPQKIIFKGIWKDEYNCL